MRIFGPKRETATWALGIVGIWLARYPFLQRRVGPYGFALIAQHAAGQTLVGDAHAYAAQAIATDGTGFNID